MPTPGPGARLGRYTLRRKLGAGGMAEVWEAFDEMLHRSVAVKVIREAISSSSDFTERFIREARLAASLEHPNILPIYDFGQEGETFYLVMPLLPGGSLKDRIRGPMPLGEAIEALSGVAAALDLAHAKGVLHRDVKPSNVLIDQSGGLLLSDFGLAKSASGTSGLTQTGMILGTPLYMSPEQAQGYQLDGRSDQYAVGVIAFELLTGIVPFSADSPLTVLHKHLQAAPPPPSSVNPNLTPEVDRVVARALAKSPAERFGSCTEFVSALAEALGVPTPRTRGRISDVSRATAPTAAFPRPLEETPTVIHATPPTGVHRGASGPVATRPVATQSQPSVPPSPPPRNANPMASTAVGVIAGIGIAALVAYLIWGRGGTPPPGGPLLVPTPVPTSVAAMPPTAAPLVEEPTPLPGPTLADIRVRELRTPVSRQEPTRAAEPALRARKTAPPEVQPTERPSERTAEGSSEGSARALPLSGKETRVAQAQVPWKPDQRVPIGVKIGEATIESVELKDMPDSGDLAKAAKDPRRTHKLTAVFRYSNRDRDDYKCKYVVTVVDADGKALGTDDRNATLNKGEVNDTNKMGVKMRTVDFKQARSLKLRFEVRRD